jgi:hypothetical protein
MPVSFHDLSFGGIGPGWSRVGATGHKQVVRITSLSVYVADNPPAKRTAMPQP